MPPTLSADQSLALWYQVTVRMLQESGPDLSSRQIAVLLTVYMNDRPHTVRGLATDLRISKPAITRALDRLCDEGLLRRKTDDRDRRSVLIQKTVKGSTFLHDFGEAIRQVTEASMSVDPMPSHSRRISRLSWPILGLGTGSGKVELS